MITRCTRCVNPSTRPNISFDDVGLCPVCQYSYAKAGDTVIDGINAAGAALDGICNWGRERARSTYDCIVTVSGGKDSTRQACFARDDLGMNPLLVNCAYPPEQLH